MDTAILESPTGKYQILTIDKIDRFGMIHFLETGTSTRHHDLEGAKVGDRYKVYCNHHPILPGSLTLKAEKL